MKNFLSVLIIILCCSSTSAGVLEDALKTNEHVLLYLYTEKCISCQNFTPRYNEIIKQNPNLKGVMVDAETRYGTKLMYKYRNRTVPYLVLINSKKNKAVNVKAQCMYDDLCFQRVKKELNI